MRNEAVGTGNNSAKYEPLSEERRRVRNYRNSFILSTFALILFIIVILVGYDKIEGRSCTFGRTLDRGVCVDCSD